jgi:hypothetical protein
MDAADSGKKTSILSRLRIKTNTNDWNEEISRNFPSCSKIVRSALLGHTKRYRKHALTYFFWFRFMGCAEITLSLLLPILALQATDPLNQSAPLISVNGIPNNLLVAIVSILVALVTSLKNFFRWQENWQLFSTQRLAVTTLVSEWEFEMIKIIEDEVEEEANRSKNARALAITGLFLERLHQSLINEHETFSDNAAPPAIPKLNSGMTGNAP